MTAKTKKVAPIPRGYRAITPHITTGDVSAAVSLYQSAFGAEVVSSETVPGVDTIIFAHLKIGNSWLTIGQGETFGPGYVSLHHYVEDASVTWDTALTAGFAEVSALKETYWGDLMGLMSDPIGVRWSIGQRVMRLSNDERQDRARSALGHPQDVEIDAEIA